MFSKTLGMKCMLTNADSSSASGCISSPALLHLFNSGPSFRRDPHNLGGNGLGLVGIEECHPRNGVVDFAMIS